MRNNERVYGKIYKLWRNGKYLGEAAWIDDKNIGDVFLRHKVDNGLSFFEVCIADEWEEVKYKDYEDKQVGSES